jgi:hypothetical protein
MGELKRVYSQAVRTSKPKAKMCLFPPFGGNADRQRGIHAARKNELEFEIEFELESKKIAQPSPMGESKGGLFHKKSEQMIQKPKCACFLPLGEMPIGKGGYT